MVGRRQGGSRRWAADGQADGKKSRRRRRAALRTKTSVTFSGRGRRGWGAGRGGGSPSLPPSLLLPLLPPSSPQRVDLDPSHTDSTVSWCVWPCVCVGLLAVTGQIMTQHKIRSRMRRSLLKRISFWPPARAVFQKTKRLRPGALTLHPPTLCCVSSLQ